MDKQEPLEKDRTAPEELVNMPDNLHVSGPEFSVILNKNLNASMRYREKNRVQKITVRHVRRQIANMREDASLLLQKAREAEVILDSVYIPMRKRLGHPRSFLRVFTEAVSGFDWTKEEI